MSGAPALKPEVDAAIQAWRPVTALAMDDPRAKTVVMPVVRALVAAAAPESPEVAYRLLWAVAPMMVWADDALGSLAPGVINPRNVYVFVTQVSEEAGRSLGWRAGAKSSLTRVGRAVNPQAWDDKPPPLPRRSGALPYAPDEEDLLLMAGRLPGARNPAGRLWVVAASCGAGLRGPEIRLAETSDIHERRDGRLVVQVRGRQPRPVPVRKFWTDAVREAVSLVNERPAGSSRKFLTASGHHAPSYAASKVPWGEKSGMSLRRARVTWLTAHVVAETPVPILKTLAGSMAECSFSHILAVLDLPITPDEAVQKGLRA